MEVAIMKFTDSKRVQAERWPADNCDDIEMQWFTTLPEAQEWIGDNCGWVIYQPPDGTQHYIWKKL